MILIFLLLFNINNVLADDSVYIISGDQVIKQDTWKFVALENITSNILIDDTQIYFYTENYIYGLNSSYGSKNFKIVLKNSLEQKLTDNLLVIKTNYKTYSINKTTGEIIQKEIYPFTLDSIYTLFGLSNSICNCTNGIDGAPGLPGLNGTDGLDGTNGSNGADGINGVNGTDGINGTNGTNSVSGGLTFFLHNNSANISYSAKVMNQSNDFVPLITNLTQNIVNGNTLLMTWVSPPMNLTLIPAGVHELHIHAAKIGNQHTDKLYYECGLTNETGDNITILSTSEITLESIIPDGNITTEFSLDMGMMDINTNLTDRMIVRLYVNQTGTGATPDIRIEYEDFTNARLVFPATPFTSEQIVGIVQPLLNTKVNKSGDKMAGNLNMSGNIILEPGLIQSETQISLQGNLSELYLNSGSAYYYNSSEVWRYTPDIGTFKYNIDIDLNNKSLLNCLNCFSISNNHSQKTISSNYLVTTSDETIFINGSNKNVTVTLPTAINNNNIYNLNRIDSNISSNVTVNTTNNETLEGLFNMRLYTQIFNLSGGGVDSHSSGQSGYIMMTQITTPSANGIVVNQLGIEIYSIGTGGSGQLALYTDSGNLLAHTSTKNYTNGRNLFDLPPTELSSNTIYWIASQTNTSSVDIFYCNTCPNRRHYKISGWVDFPSTFSGYTTDSTPQSMEIVYRTQVTSQDHIRVQSDNVSWWSI